MSSLKMTFSLASLVILIAFGLVFAPTAVMAHEDASGAVGTPRPHSHPLDVNMPEKTAPTTHTDLGTAVSAHEAHPMVTSIVAKPDAATATLKTNDGRNVILLAADGTALPIDGAAAGTFTVRVTFSGMLADNGDDTVDDNEGLNDDEVSVRAQYENGGTIDASTWNVAIAAVADETNQFDATITVPTTAYWDTTATPPASSLPIIVFVDIAAGAVETRTGFSNSLGNPLTPAASDPYRSVAADAFTVMDELPPETMEEDTTPPTLAITSVPASGTNVTAGGDVVFTFTFTDDSDLGMNDARFSSGDIDVTNNSGTPDFGGSGKVYTLTVTPADPMKPVKVTVAAGSVSDEHGNALAAGPTLTYTWMPVDDVHPTVVITGAESREMVDGMTKTVITFTFDFSEEIRGFTRDDIDASHSNFGPVLGDGQPVKSTTDPTMYTFKAVAASVGPTRIRLKAGSVMDISGSANVLLNDQDGIYTPENVPPAITISGPSLLHQRKFVDNTITVTISDELGIKDGETLAKSEIEIMNGTIGEDFAYTAANRTATFTVKPNIGAVQVKVTVKADSVLDNLDNGNEKVDKLFDVGPVLVVPANGYLVVVKDFTKQQTFTFLSDDTYPTEGNINPIRPAILSARTIQVSNWREMPDLERMFNIGTGEGGGALVLKSAAAQTTAVAKGAVAVTEIMWASDLNLIGAPGDAEAKYQWIEIENLTNADVRVHMFHRVGRETYDIESNELDRAGNFYDASLGGQRWNVADKGQNGNSYTGVDFISMHRNLPDFSKAHNYVNVNGMDDASWVKSSLQFLTKVSISPPKEYWHRGTPGRRHASATDATTTRDARTDVPASPIRINEIANRDDANNEYEWIELQNVSGGEINLNNYQISIVTAVDKDEPFIYLPNNNNAKIPAGGVLLLVDSDPYGNPDHPLAVGWNVAKNAEDQVPGLDSLGIHGMSKEGRYLVVPFGGKNNKFISGLPDNQDFLLVVRSADNHEGDHAHADKGRAELGEADLGRITDIAGYVGTLSKSYAARFSRTELWPLKEQRAGENSEFISEKNRLAVNAVHYRQHNGRNGLAGAGTTHKDRKDDQIAFRDAVYTGIGYRRQAINSAIHTGTPGYDNGVQKGSARDAAIGDKKLVISEIMLSQGEEGARTTLPQWIEIYNPSPYPVSLSGWRLIIENPREPIRTINLGGGTVKTILSKQTVLVVSGTARDIGSDTLPSSTVFAATRVYNVYQHQRNEFNMTNRFDPILDDEAFHITLIDGAALDTSKTDQQPDVAGGKHLRVGGNYYTISDVVGNLDGNPRTNDTPEDNEKMKFAAGMTEDGERTSIIRVFDRGVPRDGTGAVKPLGGTDGVGVGRMNGIDAKYSWVHAADTENRYVRHTWYGDESDWGTPLHRGGQILPVSLSKFRPERMKDTGEIVIRWITESELNNAGFNILRSETRDGEFTKVNTSLIAGHGTTSERHVYEWKDKTAKPNVVYYYQIQDVSLDGEVTPLRITRLKGNVTAAGKATTTWGELKALQ